MRGDSGVDGEGRVTGIPNFHSGGKYTMPLTNINSNWMPNASSGLCIIYLYYLLYCFMLHLGVCNDQRIWNSHKSMYNLTVLSIHLQIIIMNKVSCH